MIFAVLISMVSVGFGVYKNIQASNAEAFAYEQAYTIMGIVQDSNIPSGTKATILDAALGALTTPPPVLDLSRSSADAGTPGVCTEEKKSSCATLASELADANAACTRSKGASEDCAVAAQLKSDIVDQGCFVCYTH
jgi:hypothetical protein